MEKEEKKVSAAQHRKSAREKVCEATAEIDKGVLNVVLAGNPEKKSRHVLKYERVEIAGPLYQKIAKDVQAEEERKQEENKMKRKKWAEEEESIIRNQVPWETNEARRNVHKSYIDKQIEVPNY